MDFSLPNERSSLAASEHLGEINLHVADRLCTFFVNLVLIQIQKATIILTSEILYAVWRMSNSSKQDEHVLTR